MNGKTHGSFQEFLRLHKSQLQSLGVPGHYWHKLYEKLTEELYDAGNHIMMQQIQYVSSDDESDDEGQVATEWEVVVNAEKLLSVDPNNIFLIDHALTLEFHSLKENLINMPSVVERLCNLMDIQSDNLQTNEKVSRICNEFWKYCRYYKISEEIDAVNLSRIPESQKLIWYILDEVGSRIQHSHNPTIKLTTLYYVPRGICYSVIWPITDLYFGDKLTLDYIAHVKDETLRPYYLLPWQPADFSDNPKEHTFILTEEFFTTHCMKETLSVDIPDGVEFSHPNERELIYVFTDSKLIKTYLTDHRFQFVDKFEVADVVWIMKDFKDFRKLSIEQPRTIINQFPGERILTVKDLLACLASLVAKSKTENALPNSCPLDERLSCTWYPVTYNLLFELPQFVSYFQSLQKEKNNFAASSTEVSSAASINANNVWILKPWNLGRGVGIIITDNLDRIIRLCDTIPLIASRYITDPVLFYRDDLKFHVKFDIRYVVVLECVKPLSLCVYKVFWLRFANKPFVLKDFDDYGTHFTVMNYRDDQQLKQLHYDEFIELYNHQYPDHLWDSVQSKIFDMIIDIFQSAITFSSLTHCLTPCAQSRALYAVDLLLEWSPDHSSMHPVLCEVNFSPDCIRACTYHPNFYNHIFNHLFAKQPAEDCDLIRLM